MLLPLRLFLKLPHGWRNRVLFSGTQLSRKQKPGFQHWLSLQRAMGTLRGSLSLSGLYDHSYPHQLCVPSVVTVPFWPPGSPILHRTSPALTPYALCTPLLPKVPSPWVQARTVPSQTPSSSASTSLLPPPCSLSPAGSVCASAWYLEAPPPEARVKASETRVRNAAGRRKSRLGHSNGGPQGSCFFGRKDTREGSGQRSEPRWPGDVAAHTHGRDLETGVQ